MDDKTQREVLRNMYTVFGNNGLTLTESIDEFQLAASELHDMYTEILPPSSHILGKSSAKLRTP